MLDFRVETFLTVCRLMNFTRAAAELSITQPAVTQHIKYLEKEYQTTLFTYQGKKLQLTKAGQLLYENLMTMRHDAVYLRELIMEEETGHPEITFGATLTIGEYIMPGKLHQYLGRHRLSHLSMIVQNTSQLIQKLKKGVIDFAFVEGYFTKSEFDSIVYSKEPFICVASANHPLEKTPEQIEDLFGETIIVREEGSGSRDILVRNLEEQNIVIDDFTSSIEIGSIHGMKKLVEWGDGIAFIYRAAVEEELAKGTLVEVPLSNFQVMHNFYVIWNKNSQFASIYKEIAEELK